MRVSVMLYVCVCVCFPVQVAAQIFPIPNARDAFF